jgi:hypothetical protein
MAGYIGSKSSVKLVDGYTRAEADAAFLSPTGDGSGLTGTGSPSIVDNGNATAMTITSDENIGIGTSSPTVINTGAGIVLDVANTATTGTTADNAEIVLRSTSRFTGLTFKTPNDKASTINFGDTDDSDVGIIQYDHSNNAMSFTANASERMRIDSSGDVMVGQTAGDVGGGHLTSGIKLDSSGYIDTAKASGFAIRANRQTTEGDVLAINYNGSPIGALGSADTYNFVVESKFTDKNIEFKVNNGGSAATVAQFYGSTGAKSFGSFESFSGGYNVYAGAGSAASYGIRIDGAGTGSAGILQVVNGYGQVGSIRVNGASTQFNTSSDYRLKTDVQPMTGASARVQALNPVNFEWIADGNRTDGFLAHEAQEVVPEAITGIKDAMKDEPYEVTPAVLDDDGNITTEAVMGGRTIPDHQSIDQSKLVPLLTAALQEALTEIASLKTRVEALEA